MAKLKASCLSCGTVLETSTSNCKCDERHDCADAVRRQGCPKLQPGPEGIDHSIQAPTPSQECQVCEGTGLRFPGLSRECNYGADIGAPHPPRNCFKCQGRGRVPVDSLEAWLDAAFIADYAEQRFMSRRLKQHSASLQGYNTDEIVGYGDTRLAAVAEALCKAIGAHPEAGDD